ncbi:MAG: DUF1998 domain-containing protein [Gemmatimonadaceae bacterium]|nr:DUF1998 domain-containing protein [Gemmatimonadaceae bacterium]
MSGVRRGQLVTPFGVGAIVEVGQDSFVCADLSRWAPADTLALPESELQRITRREIRTPFASAPFVRFPRWLFCPLCRIMVKLTPDKEAELITKGFTTPRCAECKKAELTPMGFVQACEDGHLDEIDWFRWAHRNNHVASSGQCAPGAARMHFKTTGARGGDWETLRIECECGARNTLEGLTTRPLPGKCRGRQPWMSQDGDPCDKQPFGHRRGDSNLYFPDQLSAIDIVVDGAMPTGGLRAFLAEQLAKPTWAPARTMAQAFAPKDVAQAWRQLLSDLAQERGVSLAEIEEAFILELEGKPNVEANDHDLSGATQEEILRREWPVLSRRSDLEHPSLIIRVRPPHEDWSLQLKDAVESISLLPRLREVRALLSFRRVSDGGLRQPLHSAIENHWLPGVEVWGEGVFIRLSEEYVSRWENSLSPSLLARLQRLAQLHQGSGRSPATVTARFLAVHTLSHALIRRLAFDAGYSSTALRERVYAGDGMAGLLIYTADADSEGSLGGLVRMGEPATLGRTLEAALNDAAWCSADPVCAETRSQGVRGMNGSACHACSLISETSCTFHNQLLDRHFLLSVEDGRMDSGLLPVPPLPE